MKLNITNLGIIKSADLELRDITTIIGKNGNGKSTIGKAIYTVVKAQSNSLKDIYNMDKENLLSKQRYHLSAVLERLINKNLLPENEIMGYFINSHRSYFNEDYFGIELNDSELENLLNNLKLFLDLQLNNKLQQKNELQQNDEFIFLIKEAKRYINQIENFINDSFETHSIKKRMAQNILNTVFSNPITTGENELKIFLDSFKLEYSQNNLNYSYTNNNLEDVIYIDSLQAFSNENNGSNHRKRNSVDHVSELRKTILNIKNNNENIFGDILYKEINDIENKVQQTIKGNMSYNQAEKKIKFKSNNGEEFALNDIASGIKSLGLYLLILKQLDSKTILILDEPEIHLHPEWQVVLAELIILINKKLKTKVLINTHSAFFLEAIQKYSLKYTIDSKFYFCSNGHFEDVSNDLNKAFSKVNGNSYKMLDSILEDSHYE